MDKTLIPVTAGVVLLRQENHLWQVLLLRAYRNWDFPKGMLEPGEDAFRAAKRELREETGISDDDTTWTWGDRYIKTAPYRSTVDGKSVLKRGQFFLAQIAGKANVILSREHQEFRWFDFATAKQRVVPRYHEVLHWTQELAEKGYSEAQ